MPRRRGERSALFPSCAAGLVVLVALSPARASAEERERLVDLEWTAPAGCPGGDEVVARVEDLVGRSQLPAHRAVSARGRVTTSPASASERRYRLDLVIVGNEANKRSMSGDDCSHLVDAAALVLALDIDPDLLVRGEAENAPSGARDPLSIGAGAAPPASASVAGPPPRKAPTPATGPRPAPRAARGRPRVRLTGGARLALDEGSLPRTALGVGPVIGLASGPLMLELQGTVYQEQFTVVGPRKGHAGAYIALSTLAAHACWRSLVFNVDWRGCVGGELGLESATGVNVALSETASALWSAVSAMLIARALPRRLVSPVAGLALVHPIGTPPAFIEGFGTIFEPSPVVVRGFLGLDIVFF